MHTDQFTAIVDAQLQRCREVLVPKGQEYSRHGDRLWNFKRAAAQLGTSPEKALLGMEVKHRTAILDLVDDLDAGVVPAPALVDEKFTDAINYLMLLRGLLVERQAQAGGGK